jgi:acyl-CoA thioesterase-2
VRVETDEFFRALTAEPVPGAAGRFVGRPGFEGEVLFGGFVIGQAVSAAAQSAPPGLRLHSFHAYFLRPQFGGRPVDHDVTGIRDGRSFSTRRLVAAQDGKPALEALCSYTADVDGDEYDLPAATPFPPVDSLDHADEGGPAAWVGRRVGPPERKWVRVPAPVPDDPALHAALLGFASDWTGRSGRPLDPQGDPSEMFSIDHAVWFHRPPRADRWHAYEVEALVQAGSRSLLRGTMRDESGRVVLSMTQEMLLR